MNLSRPFIERPVATSLLAFAVLLAGAVAFTQLPVSPLPRVDFPTISVTAALPGGSPETMASVVAAPLERPFGRIAGLTEMTSTSVLGGTQIALQFDLDRDVDAAARDVQAAIYAAAGELPTNLPTRPTYRKVNPADSPVLVLALMSRTLRLGQVYDAATTILAQKISQVPGVGQVTIGGGQQPAVRIDVDPPSLASMGLSIEDVRTAIAAATSNGPKGALDGSGARFFVASDTQLANADEWRRVLIRVADRSSIRLGDVARVADSVENNRAAGWFDGRRAIVVVIRRQPGANILEVIARVKALLPELRASISPAIDVAIAIDRAQTIRASVRDVEETLVLSVILVVVVVYVFLRSVRATVVPSFAVPLSLVATFGVMYLVGFSIDNLSLMALTIATGFVVDDAIVVTENVARKMESGLGPHEAALEGAKQIGFTIVSITASLLAVFVPVLFMGGIVGRLFREFAVTLSIAIMVSALVSLTVTPSMCARLLSHQVAPAGRTKVEQLYGRALRVVLGHRRLVNFVTVALVGLTVYLYGVVPKGLFPTQDTGLLFGSSEGPEDMSFLGMRERQEELQRIVRSDPAVEHVTGFLGLGGTENTGLVFIGLLPRPPRRVSVVGVLDRLRPRLAHLPGMKLFLQPVQDVRVGGRLTRTTYQYTLQAVRLDELREWAPRLLAKLRTLPQLLDVATDQQTAGLELFVTIDRDTASRVGVSAAAIDGALYDAFGQRQVATYFGAANQYRVVLEANPADASTPDALRNIYVPSTTGAQIPLLSLVHVETRRTSLSVNHQGQFPSVTISFNTPQDVSLGHAVEAVRKAEREIAMPASMHADFSGTAQAFRSSLASEPYLILAALVTVYLLLGILYESYIHPITILSTLPSAGIGALVALLICDLDLDVMSLVGILLLIGIVKKNAILMIDFAIEAERERGLSPIDAIHEACILRFRPILMTTLAALFGALPLALGTGTGSEMRRPLGIAIVGGLLASQAVTLFTTPAVYLALDRFQKKRRRIGDSPTAPAST